MGIFDQMKMAKEMMKNMSPDEIKNLMSQAGEYKQQMEDVVRKVVDEEIKRRNLMTREEVQKLIEQAD